MPDFQVATPCPLIFLHGAVGSPGDWQVLGEEMGVDPGRACFPDLHCREVAEGMDDLAAVIEAYPQAGKGAVLVGYSMGGRIALQLLLRDPDRYAGAVVVSGHPGLEGEVEEARRLEDDHEWARKARLLPWGEFLWQWESRGVLRTGRPAAAWRPDLAAAWHAARAALEERRGWVADAIETYSLGRQGDLRPALRRVRKPLLWVAGALDPKFSELALDASGLNPLAACRIVPETGHRVPWEAPGAFARLLADFLTKLA